MEPQPLWDVLVDDLIAFSVPILVALVGVLAVRQKKVHDDVVALDIRNSRQHGENAAELRNAAEAARTAARGVVALTDTVNETTRETHRRLGAIESDVKDVKDWQVGHDALHQAIQEQREGTEVPSW